MFITVSIYICTSSNAHNLQMLEVYTYNLHSCFLRFTEATMPTITLSLWMKISAQQVFASGLWAPCCFSASWSFCSFSSGTIRPREKHVEPIQGRHSGTLTILSDCRTCDLKSSVNMVGKRQTWTVRLSVRTKTFYRSTKRSKEKSKTTWFLPEKSSEKTAQATTARQPEAIAHLPAQLLNHFEARLRNRRQSKTVLLSWSTCVYRICLLASLASCRKEA